MTIWRRRKVSPEPHPVVPSSIWISTQLLDRTADVLRASGDGHETHEGVAYWAGRRAGNECFVTTCIAPSATTTYGSFDTSAHTNAKVVMYVAGAGLELIGQIHSHPGRFVDHSDGDDQRALMPYEGFLSIVVPHYARGGMRPLTICGVHVFEQSQFRRLSKPEIEACFHVIDAFADLRT
jgi:proteasome lid subunit RPN8/RPN11